MDRKVSDMMVLEILPGNMLILNPDTFNTRGPAFDSVNSAVTYLLVGNR